MTVKMKLLVTCLPTLFFSSLLVSCAENDPSESEVNEVNKKGSVEMVLTTTHIDGNKDLLKIPIKIYKDGQLIKEIMVQDTLPNLGETTEEAENEDGDVKTLKVPKDYEFFVTVK
jgi:hypothetical protein